MVDGTDGTTEWTESEREQGQDVVVVMVVVMLERLLGEAIEAASESEISETIINSGKWFLRLLSNPELCNHLPAGHLKARIGGDVIGGPEGRQG